MALVDLKKTQEEVRPNVEAPSEVRRTEEYPYGLRLTLDKDSLSKLELPIKQLNVNGTVDLICKGKIIDIRSNLSADESEDQSVEIQITHLDFNTLIF